MIRMKVIQPLTMLSTLTHIVGFARQWLGGYTARLSGQAVSIDLPVSLLEGVQWFYRYCTQVSSRVTQLCEFATEGQYCI